MAHDLVETATFDTPITVPDPGDPAQAGVVAAAFSAVANRAQFLKQYTDMVATGVYRIRTINVSAMPTTTGVVDGDIAYDPGKGFFFFYVDTAHFFTPDGYWVIASTVITDGVWLNVEYGKVNANGGFPSIGPTFQDSGIASSKIKQSLQTNYLVAQGRLPTSGIMNDYFEDGNSREVADSRFTLAVVVGDKILINLGPLCVSNQAASIQMIELRYSTNNGASWGVLDRYNVMPRNAISGNSYRSFLSGSTNLTITGFTGNMVFCLWGIVDAIDSLGVSTASDYTYDIGTYTQFRA